MGEQREHGRHAEAGLPSAEGRSRESVLSPSEQWQQLIDALPDPIWVKDVNGRYVAVNQAYRQADPAQESNIVGKTDADVFPAEKAAAYVADDRTAIREGICEHEFSSVNASGELRYYFTKKAAIRDEQGKLMGIVGMARDITDHRHIEIELAFEARRSRLLARILESASTADTVGIFLSEALSAARELLGYDRGGIYILDGDRRRACLVSAQGELADIQAQAPAVPADEEPFMSVYSGNRTFITTDWHNRGPQATANGAPLVLAVVPLSNRGHVAGSLNVAWHQPYVPDKQLKETVEAIAKEIAIGMDRIQAANSWVESESSLHTLFDSVQEVVLVLDSNGRILAANKHAVRSLGYTAETLLGMNITDLRPASEKQKAITVINAMSTGMRASSRIETMITSTGDPIAVETTVTRGLWKSAPAVFSVSRDMSSRLQSEEQLKALLMSDALTGLYNLRGFAALAGQQLKTAYRAHISAAVIFAHVDTGGIPSAARPEILHAFASCLSQTFRDSDITARIGRTRFAVLAIQTDGSKLELLVQRLRDAIEHFNAGRSSGSELNVKITAIRAGVPGFMSVDDLLKHADREMGPVEEEGGD